MSLRRFLLCLRLEGIIQMVYQTHYSQEKQQNHVRTRWCLLLCRLQTSLPSQANQIGVLVATMNRLQQEGITSPINLKDFDDEALKIVKENLQHPAGRIADPNPNANGATIPTPPFVFGTCSQTRLAATAKCI